MDINGDNAISQEEFLSYFIIQTLFDVNQSSIDGQSIGAQLMQVSKDFESKFWDHLGYIQMFCYSV